MLKQFPTIVSVDAPKKPTHNMFLQGPVLRYQIFRSDLLKDVFPLRSERGIILLCSQDLFPATRVNERHYWSPGVDGSSFVHELGSHVLVMNNDHRLTQNVERDNGSVCLF